MMKRINFLRN